MPSDLSILRIVGRASEPNDEFSGAPVAGGTRDGGKRVRWNEQLGCAQEIVSLVYHNTLAL